MVSLRKFFVAELSVAEMYEPHREFNPIVYDLYRYYTRHTSYPPHRGGRVGDELGVMANHHQFLDTHQALLSRLSQYFDPLRRQIQAMPVISKDALEQLIIDFAAQHPVFTVPR